MMKEKIRIAGLVEDSIVDGPGIRLAIFTQGCYHNCEGCHNKHTQDPYGGYWVTAGEIIDRVTHNPLCGGITLTGGEPVEQSEALIPVAQAVRDMKKNVWMYTGYTWEQLFIKMRSDHHIEELLHLVDVLVDGKFEISMRNLDLMYRGSVNQRLIDVQKSFQAEQIILWHDSIVEYYF